LAGLIDLGHEQSATDYQEILLHRHDFCGQVRTMFDNIDVLVIPAQAAAAPTWKQMENLGDDPDLLASLLRFTAPFDLTGSPALTMPSGFTKAGMPVAIQFVGRHFEEDVLVRAGHAYQRETDWHHQHPAV
jgi:amidase